MFLGSGVKIECEGSKDVSKKAENIEINTQGARHLGAAVGTDEFKRMYVQKKVANWVDAIKSLSQIAATQPHAAFSTFTQCLQSQWTFVSRAMPDISTLFEPLEQAIRLDFLPALLHRAVNDLERQLLALPARLGGLGILLPTESCKRSHSDSLAVTQPLVALIMCQSTHFDPRALSEEVSELRKGVDRGTETYLKGKLDDLMKRAPPTLASSIKIARVKGASSWVTAVPSFEHGTILHKKEFSDALCLRYGWTPPDLPTVCACGSAFDVKHSLECQLGGFRTIQHNEVRDVLATCMREAGHLSVEVEPQLQPLSGEVFDFKSANKEEDARSDIKCTGFWRPMRQAFFDVKIVSPLARSYASLEPAQLFRMAEKAKIREYSERIHQVEHADFSPLVFTTAGGMAPQSHLVVKRIAEKISEKQDLHLSIVSGWLRCRLSFALLRTTLMCLRGTRRKKQFFDTNIELAVSEARMNKS